MSLVARGNKIDSTFFLIFTIRFSLNFKAYQILYTALHLDRVIIVEYDNIILGLILPM